MGDETEWQRTGREVATAARSTQLTIGSTGANQPLTTKAEFAGEVGPALALVAPTGMDVGERKTWLGAAHRALAHLDADTLARAVQAATLKADHPSKLVPLIAAEAERLTTGYRPMSTIIPVPFEPAPPETDEERRNREELAEMMRSLRQRLEANAA